MCEVIMYIKAYVSGQTVYQILYQLSNSRIGCGVPLFPKFGRNQCSSRETMQRIAQRSIMTEMIVPWISGGGAGHFFECPRRKNVNVKQ